MAIATRGKLTLTQQMRRDPGFRGRSLTLTAKPEICPGIYRDTVLRACEARQAIDPASKSVTTMRLQRLGNQVEFLRNNPSLDPLKRVMSELGVPEVIVCQDSDEILAMDLNENLYSYGRENIKRSTDRLEELGRIASRLEIPGALADHIAGHLSEGIPEILEIRNEGSIVTISKSPVTAFQFLLFQIATGRKDLETNTNLKYLNEPAKQVSGFDAEAYARWLGNITAKRFRLPCAEEFDTAKQHPAFQRIAQLEWAYHEYNHGFYQRSDYGVPRQVYSDTSTSKEYYSRKMGYEYEDVGFRVAQTLTLREQMSRDPGLRGRPLALTEQSYTNKARVTYRANESFQLEQHPTTYDPRISRVRTVRLHAAVECLRFHPQREGIKNLMSTLSMPEVTIKRSNDKTLVAYLQHYERETISGIEQEEKDRINGLGRIAQFLAENRTIASLVPQISLTKDALMNIHYLLYLVANKKTDDISRFAKINRMFHKLDVSHEEKQACKKWMRGLLGREQ